MKISNNDRAAVLVQALPYIQKYSGETTIVSMRMSKEMLRDIDSVASLVGRTRNEIMAMSLEFALEHMEIAMKEREDTKNGSD